MGTLGYDANRDRTIGFRLYGAYTDNSLPLALGVTDFSRGAKLIRATCTRSFLRLQLAVLRAYLDRILGSGGIQLLRQDRPKDFPGV